MTKDEAIRRDRALRDSFADPDPDAGAEARLTRELVLESWKLLPEFPFLVDHEWEPVPGHCNGGRGDLLFTDGAGAYAVVEVKSIFGSGTNTNRRTKVEDQARRYRRAAEARFIEAVRVEAFVYTDDEMYPGLRAPLRPSAPTF